MILEVSLILISIISLYIIKRKNDVQKDLPPGPWGLPLIGHLLFFGLNPTKKLMEWRDTFGNIYFIKFGDYPIVVLNDTESIKEAFNMPVFSGRTQIDLFVKATDGKGIGMTEGTICQEQRQFFLKAFKLFSKNIETSIQEDLVDLIKYIQEIGERGKKPVPVNQLFGFPIGNSIWNIMMGERFRRDDARIKTILANIASVAQFDSVLTQLSLFMPSIAKLGSFSGFDSKLCQLKDITAYMDEHVERHKLTWVKDQPRDLSDAYTDRMANTSDPASSFHPQHKFQAQTTVDFFGASTSTTVTTLEWLMYYLAGSESVQKKLQTEIHQVVGNSRLPCLDDRGQMPYTEAVIYELLRLSSVLPIGAFHRTLTDVEFRGFKIPRDTTVMANLFGVHYDKGTWGDPENFRPERFLMNDGQFDKTMRKNVLAFSTGRRSCIGSDPAMEQIFLYVTFLCQTFDIQFPSPIPKVKTLFGITSAPTPFHVHFKERRMSSK